MSAYDFVLQALDQLYRLDFASFSRAHELLQQAIKEDARYAWAYSYLAYWHILRVGQGWSPDSVADARDAERSAASAIEHDRNDAQSLAICGHVHAYLRQDFRNAVGYLDRALEAGPNSAMAWSTASLTSAYLGDGATAVARAEHGLRLSPRDPHVFWHLGAMAIAHYVSGNLETAVQWAEQSRQQNSVFTSNHRILAASLAGLGRTAEAQMVCQEALTIDPGFRLPTHLSRTPWRGPTRETLYERLLQAGFPD